MLQVAIGAFLLGASLGGIGVGLKVAGVKRLSQSGGTVTLAGLAGAVGVALLVAAIPS